MYEKIAPTGPRFHPFFCCSYSEKFNAKFSTNVRKSILPLAAFGFQTPSRINKKHNMSIIAVGSMAFDAIETPFGKVDRIIGGAATYISYAASNFVTPIRAVSIVGNDFPDAEMAELKRRGVSLEG